MTGSLETEGKSKKKEVKKVCHWGRFHMTGEVSVESFWNGLLGVNGLIPWIGEAFAKVSYQCARQKYSIYCENTILYLNYLTHGKNSLNNVPLLFSSKTMLLLITLFSAYINPVPKSQPDMPFHQSPTTQ